MSKSICFTLGLNLLSIAKDKFQYIWEEKAKIEKYWDSPSSTQTNPIQLADQLFEAKQYFDVYETLNRLKYSDDVEVIWRMARALYNLSLNINITLEARREMIEEAEKILVTSKSIGGGCCNYHKWMAVVIDSKNDILGLENKIQNYAVVRDELMLASKCNPTDFAVQYMLGRWHYEMANLTWFQRKIAKYLYEEPPPSTFKDAYKYLQRAEELYPRSFLPNIYILGKTCAKLGLFYRAKYYLNLAQNLDPHSECDKDLLIKSKRLLDKLEKYDLGYELLYNTDVLGFGFDN